MSEEAARVQEWEEWIDALRKSTKDSNESSTPFSDALDAISLWFWVPIAAVMYFVIIGGMAVRFHTLITYVVPAGTAAGVVIGLAYRSKGRPFAVSISLAVFGALIVFLVAANLTTAQDWQVYITATIAMTIVGGISFLVLWRAGKGGDASFLALVALLLAFVVFSKASIAAGNVYFDQFCKPNPIYKICDGNSNYQHQLGDDTTGLVSLVELAEYYSGQRCAGMNNEVNVAVWGTRRQYESSTYHEDGNFVFDKPLDDGTASFRARDNAAEALHMGAVGTKVTVACVD